MNKKALSTLIVQDYCQVGGGAERLVIVLKKSLPRSELWASGLYEGFLKSGMSKDADVHVLGERLSFLPRPVRAILSFLLLGKKLPRADNVIYSGIYSPLAAAAQSAGRRICYCHTPPKFAFEQEEKYRLSTNRFLRPIFTLAVAIYRWIYLRAMRRMDLIVTNSKHVQWLINSHLGLPSQVIYPPVDVELFRWIEQSDFHLSLGRLEPNKRVHLVVEAFRQMPDKKLVVASGGSQLQQIKKLAEGAPNISVLGWVNDRQLAELIGKALSCIYIPENEDFGMSAVEAMAAGKPVIAVDDGGLKETVIDGVTGYLLPASFGIDDICSAVAKLDGKTAMSMRHACEDRSKDFSTARFVEKIQAILHTDSE